MFRLRSLLAVSIVLVIIFTGCTMWSEPKNPSWKQATGVEQMERLLWQEMKAKNWTEVEAHLASNYTHIAPEGVTDKQATLEIFKKMTLQDYSLGEFQVTQSGDTWLVTYTATYSFLNEGKTTGPKTNRVLSVWQKQKSGFVVISNVDLGN